MDIYATLAMLTGLPRSYVKERIMYLAYGGQWMYPEDEMMVDVVDGWVIRAGQR